MGLIQRRALGCGIVIIVIVRIADDRIFRGIISIPAVWMPSVPVVAPVAVAGPIAAKADENEFTVVIRPEIAKCERRAPIIANWTTTIRPGYPVENPVRRIMVTIIVIKASARG